MFTCVCDHMAFFNLCIKWARTGRCRDFALTQKENFYLHLIAANYLLKKRNQREKICVFTYEQNKWI